MCSCASAKVLTLYNIFLKDPIKAQLAHGVDRLPLLGFLSGYEQIGDFSRLRLTASFQHKAYVVRAQDLLLEVVHEVSQAGKVVHRAMQAVAALLYLNLKVLELLLATQYLRLSKQVTVIRMLSKSVQLHLSTYIPSSLPSCRSLLMAYSVQIGPWQPFCILWTISGGATSVQR